MLLTKAFSLYLYDEIVIPARINGRLGWISSLLGLLLLSSFHLSDALDKHEHLFDNGKCPRKMKETSKRSDGLTMDMDKADKVYIAIDLKSFYASVECVERGLNPLTTCLLVADASRTDKTICLAVSPGLKAYGIPGRPRLFEAKQKQVLQCTDNNQGRLDRHQAKSSDHNF